MTKQQEEINLGKNCVQMGEALRSPAEGFGFDCSGTEIGQNPTAVSGKVEPRLKVTFS